MIDNLITLFYAPPTRWHRADEMLASGRLQRSNLRIPCAFDMGCPSFLSQHMDFEDARGELILQHPGKFMDESRLSFWLAKES